MLHATLSPVRGIGPKILLTAIVLCALVPLWGYWYSIRHASLNLRVDDYGLNSPTQLYGVPHNVTLVLRDASNHELAAARSIDPLGYILAVHPDAAIGNCEHLNQRPAGEFAACYERYSRWSAGWAASVRRADVEVAGCEVRGVPVAIERSNTEWPLWWVPLPHVGGLPRQYFGFVIAIDSRACRAVVQ